GCENSDDCSFDRTCFNKLCINVCDGDLCGFSAVCSVEYHRPKCRCPPGTTGNPNVKCSALLTYDLPKNPPITERPVKVSDSLIVPIQGTSSATPEPIAEFISPTVPLSSPIPPVPSTVPP
ncbi:hypothetical protein FHG87_018688, partial [Trinorchestia longiramus]